MIQIHTIFFDAHENLLDLAIGTTMFEKGDDNVWVLTN
jgi:hypothetical protein